MLSDTDRVRSRHRSCGDVLAGTQSPSAPGQRVRQPRRRAKRTAIVGYSMGADVIPFAWSHLKPDVKAEINLIGLIGLETTADFQISVSGWLGVASSSDVDVKPLLSQLPMDRTLCFYGADEVSDDETACTDPAMKSATLIQRPGGHHFDGDYEPVARTILDRLVKK